MQILILMDFKLRDLNIINIKLLIRADTVTFQLKNIALHKILKEILQTHSEIQTFQR
jgi:hypothetical protein